MHQYTHTLPTQVEATPQDLTSSILCLPGLTATERLILCLIALDGECTRQQVEIASHTHCSRRSVVSALGRLEECGYISREYGPGGPHRHKRQTIHTQRERILEDARPADIEQPKRYGRKPISTTKALSVFDRDGYACKHCGTRKGLTVDHIIPLFLGGSDEMENLQTLCGPCNSRKGVSFFQES